MTLPDEHFWGKMVGMPRALPDRDHAGAGVPAWSALAPPGPRAGGAAASPRAGAGGG
ncbi:MAG: hypothetical protein M0Z93_07090 [Actinomycetota bacterium]|nr:hypothetical protein [Actinomycetota bacterium]